MASVEAAGRAAQLHFARGAAGLNAHGKAVLDRLAAAVNGCPRASVHISGHADADGLGPRNLMLSRRRARSVAVYLVNKGIDAGRVEAVGYGETRPVAPNNNRANRAKNRRIEVVTSERDANGQIRSSAMQGTDHGLSDR
jgi:outer membrane protein OmpA-like peptidoglycan-associated protein